MAVLSGVGWDELPGLRQPLADQEPFCTRCGAQSRVRHPACGRDSVAGTVLCTRCGGRLEAGVIQGDQLPLRRATSLRSEPGRRQLTVLFADLVGSTALSGVSIPRTCAR